jgi:hypothetical protein
MEVLQQTYAESPAGISAAVDDLQGRHAKTSSAESLAVLIRTKPSRGTVADRRFHREYHEPIDDYFARRALLKTSGPKGARPAG